MRAFLQTIGDLSAAQSAKHSVNTSFRFFVLRLFTRLRFIFIGGNDLVSCRFRLVSLTGFRCFSNGVIALIPCTARSTEYSAGFNDSAAVSANADGRCFRGGLIVRIDFCAACYAEQSAGLKNSAAFLTMPRFCRGRLAV